MQLVTAQTELNAITLENILLLAKTAFNAPRVVFFRADKPVLLIKKISVIILSQGRLFKLFSP